MQAVPGVSKRSLIQLLSLPNVARLQIFEWEMVFVSWQRIVTK